MTDPHPCAVLQYVCLVRGGRAIMCPGVIALLAGVTFSDCRTGCAAGDSCQHMGADAERRGLPCSSRLGRCRRQPASSPAAADRVPAVAHGAADGA